MCMQTFSTPPLMVPDLQEKTSQLVKHTQSGLTKLEALYIGCRHFMEYGNGMEYGMEYGME